MTSFDLHHINPRSQKYRNQLENVLECVLLSYLAQVSRMFFSRNFLKVNNNVGDSKTIKELKDAIVSEPG